MQEELGREAWRVFCFIGFTSKGLILAQNERWRRGLGMQVVRSARGVAQG